MKPRRLVFPKTVEFPESPMGLVEALRFYEKRRNGGRGISCVKRIVNELLCEREESAKAIAQNESDKLRNYPEIERLICLHLVELHPGHFLPCPYQGKKS